MMSFRKPSKHEKKQNNILYLSEIQNEIAKHPSLNIASNYGDSLKLFGEFIYRDQVTFRSIEAKFLQHSKYKKYVYHPDHHQLHSKESMNQTMKNIDISKAKTNKNIEQSILDRNLSQLKRYMEEIQAIKKYRNQDLMKNIRNTKLKSKQNYSSTPTLVLEHSIEKQKSKNFQSQICELKKKVSTFNREETRKYLEKQIRFSDIHIQLFEVQKQLKSWNQGMKINNKSIRDIIKKKEPQHQRLNSKDYKKIQKLNKENLDGEIPKQFNDFQKFLPKMIRARIAHETDFNWLQKYSQRKQKMKKNIRKKNCRNSMN